MNKQHIIIFTVLMLAVINLHCEKDEQNIMEGVISEVVSGEPVNNVEVVLQANEVSSGSISSSYKTISTTNTDNNGNFKFTFEAKTVVSYRLLFNKYGYIPHQIIISPSDYVDTYTINEKIAISSKLTLNIENVNPMDENDRLGIQIRSNYEDYCSSCCHSDWRNFYGTDINESISCPVVGGDSLTILRVIEKGNSTQSSETSIFIPPGKTIEQDITY